jgi:hypothetical protein
MMRLVFWDDVLMACMLDLDGHTWLSWEVHIL